MTERQDMFQRGLNAAFQQGIDDATLGDRSFINETSSGLDAEYRALQAFTRDVGPRQFVFQGNEMQQVKNEYLTGFNAVATRSTSPAAGGKRRRKTKRSHRRHKRRPTHRKLRR